MSKAVEEAEALLNMGAKMVDAGTLHALLEEHTQLLRRLSILLEQWRDPEFDDGLSAVEGLKAAIHG